MSELSEKEKKQALKEIEDAKKGKYTTLHEELDFSNVDKKKENKG